MSELCVFDLLLQSLAARNTLETHCVLRCSLAAGKLDGIIDEAKNLAKVDIGVDIDASR